jgi:hypothetical protein
VQLSKIEVGTEVSLQSVMFLFEINPNIKIENYKQQFEGEIILKYAVWKN